MADFEQIDKVLCRCGVVSWTPTMAEGDPPKYILREACPGCGLKDNVDEIGSIQKMSSKKAAATIGAACDLLEIEPLQALNGRTARQVKDLAQHLEDLGRPLAAERLRKGWDALMAGFLKGAKELFPGLSSPKPSNAPQGVLVAKGYSQAKGPAAFVAQAVPACIACREAVVDHKDNHIPLCSQCMTTLKGPKLITILETELEQRQRVVDRVGAGVTALKERLTALKASQNK